MSKFAPSDHIFLMFSAGQFEQQVRRGDQQVDEVVDRHQEVQGNLRHQRDQERIWTR